MEQKKGTQWVPKKQEDPGLLARLSRPTGPVDVVLDTDTYNEIDDQFAVQKNSIYRQSMQRRFLMKNPQALQMEWRKAIRRS